MVTFRVIIQMQQHQYVQDSIRSVHSHLDVRVAAMAQASVSSILRAMEVLWDRLCDATQQAVFNAMTPHLIARNTNFLKASQHMQDLLADHTIFQIR